MVAIYIVLGILVLILLYFIITYNSLIKSRNDVKEAFATMDVYLKKRWDLIPNLVEVVKTYANHEKTVLEEITKFRSVNYNELNLNSKLDSNEKLSNTLNRIFAVSENYPELKANESFLDLSQQLINIENDIASSRKYYNAVVRNLNNKVETVPSNIVANIFNITTMRMFEIGANEKNNTKVEL